MTPETSQLVESHLPLVKSVLASVAAHFPRHADLQELAQAGTLGLVEAANRYDSSRGVPFAPWAAVRIRGAILDSVRALDFTARSVRGTMREVESIKGALEHKLGRTPTVAELADAAGLPLSELHRLQAEVHGALVLSLDVTVTTDSGESSSLASSIIDRIQVDPADVLVEREKASYVRDALGQLPERLRDVIESYFLRGESSASIAERLGVTHSRVSQMRNEGLALMRTGLDHVYDETAQKPAEEADTSAAACRKAAYAASVATRSSYASRIAAGSLPRQREAEQTYSPTSAVS